MQEENAAIAFGIKGALPALPVGKSYRDAASRNGRILSVPTSSPTPTPAVIRHTFSASSGINNKLKRN